MKRMLFIVGLCLVFSLGLVIGVWAAPAEKVAKVGLVGSWTGPYGANGLLARTGALVAQKQINEEGKFIVAGQKYKLEFVEWDDRTDPKMAVAGANKLMAQDGIKVFLGPMISASTLAVQPITESQKAIIVTFSIADQIIRPGIRYTVRCSTPASWTSQAVMRYIVEQMGAKTYAVMTENSAAALAGIKAGTAILDSLGAKMLGNEVFEMGTTDFFTPLTKLKVTNPDFLFIGTGNAETLGLAIRQTKEIGWPVQTVSATGAAVGSFFNIAGKGAEGHLEVMQLNKVDPGPQIVKVAGLDLSLRKRLAEEMKKAFPKEDPMATHVCHFFDMTYLIVEAMKDAGTVDDTDRIMKGFLNTKFRGVLFQFNFMPNGQAKALGYPSLIHADGSFDPLSFCLPQDEEHKNWKTTVISKVRTIKEIRAERGY